MKILEIKKCLVITLLFLLTIVSEVFCKDSKRPQEPVPPKNIKVELKGNNAIIQWEGVKDKRVIGYLLRFYPVFVDVLHNLPPEPPEWTRFSKDTNCVITNLDIEEYKVEVETIIYDSEIKTEYPERRYSVSEWSSPIKFSVKSKEKISDEEYNKLKKEEKENEIPLLTIKDLKKNPQLYEGKIIYVQATAHVITASNWAWFKENGEILFVVNYSEHSLVGGEQISGNEDVIDLMRQIKKGLFMGTLLPVNTEGEEDDHNYMSKFARSSNGKSYIFCELLRW